MKNIGLLLLSSLLCLSAFGQIGGESVYTFLSLPHTARVTALGGNLITVKDDDATLAYHNPAALNASMHQQISFSNSFYYAGINHGFVSYGHHSESKKATFYGGIQYITYGDFLATDPNGQITGTFNAAEYALSFGGGFQYNERLSFGANAKILTANYEAYSSLGIASDLGVFYEDTAQRFTATLVFKNIGTQLTTFHPDNRENLPFDVQIGISKRLKYLPFRLSIIAHNLHRWDIRYNDPNTDRPTLLFVDGEAETNTEPTYFFDTFFRHLIFNGEFLLGKKENFRMRIGYNHLRRGELTVPSTIGFAGFSFGLGLKVKQFRIDFGRGIYHLSGGFNHITISTNFNEFKR